MLGKIEKNEQYEAVTVKLHHHKNPFKQVLNLCKFFRAPWWTKYVSNMTYTKFWTEKTNYWWKKNKSGKKRN